MGELAETELLPFKMEHYATVMEDGVKVLNDSGILKKLSDLQIETSYFIEAIQEFRAAAKGFDYLTSGSNDLSQREIRVLNDQLRGFEKTFLLYEGLPDRIQYRHVITAPSLFDAYGGSAFPGVGDLMFSLEELEPESEQYEKVVKQLRKHISDLMIIVQRAAEYLRPMPTYGTSHQGNEKKEDQEEKRPIKFCRKCDLKLD